MLAYPGPDVAAANPYTALLFSRLRQRGVEVVDYGRGYLAPFRRHVDVFHVQWPDYVVNRPELGRTLVKLVLFVTTVLWQRACGARLVWTVHNVEPHERAHPRLSRWLFDWWPRQVDAWTTLSQTAAELASQHIPRLASLPCRVAPHGDYRPWYPTPPDRTAARQRLGMPAEAFTYLFVGEIKPYKGVTDLLRAFTALDEEDVRLRVAGRVSDEHLLDELEHLAAADARVTFVPGFVPEAEVPVHLAAGDLVVLPFTSVLHSGSALLALSFDRPVLAPDVGSVSELKASVGDDWVRTYTGALSAQHLREARRWVDEHDRDTQAPLGDHTWETAAERTHKLYDAVVGDAGGP